MYTVCTSNNTSPEKGSLLSLLMGWAVPLILSLSRFLRALKDICVSSFLLAGSKGQQHNSPILAYSVFKHNFSTVLNEEEPQKHT